MSVTADIRRALRSISALAKRRRNGIGDSQNSDTLSARLLDVFTRTWDLGFTAFGGPPVHFQIIYARFVVGEGDRTPWIDEQTYQELFAVCQALPGPASTKMLFSVTFVHAGFIPALMVFILWCLPGATAMFGLSLGVQRISEILPSPVYALLSGLNASTVGIIALAAVQLAEKAIKDKLSRILVIFGACAGLCYNALWYFPVLMVVGGTSTMLWDGHIKGAIARYKSRRQRRSSPSGFAKQNAVPDAIPLEQASATASVTQRKTNNVQAVPATNHEQTPCENAAARTLESTTKHHKIPMRIGVFVAIAFFASFTTVLVVRGVVDPLPLAFSLFANMYLAGTIIFGGGPVVIPLLRSYVVDPGWVSGRDFLLGLAIIQAMPGPNFNFAVYLGALALQRSSIPTVFGSLLAFIGIFLPGLSLAVAVQGLWRVMRTKPWVINTLRGINATAVGLVFTAVYRLWEIGYLTPQRSSGQSLALEPWWVVVAAVTYAESSWFKVPPPAAIVLGAVLGLCWYGAVGR